MRMLTKNKLKKCLSMFLATGVLLSNSQLALANVNITDSTKDGWNLVWNDEFNEDYLDSSKWSYEVGNSNGWGNRELQYYTGGDNVSFDGNNLVITAKKEEKTDGTGTYNYTSTRMRTHEKYAKKYGRIEANIKLPEGNGMWPAFWMMPEDDVYGGWAASGELDIMEARGRVLNEVSGTLHYGGSAPSNKYSGASYTFPDGEDITGFHEYAIEWEPGEIRWYVDDVLYQTQTNWNTYGADGVEKYSFPAPFDQEFYMILNLAVGGNFDNGIKPDDNFTSAQMLVDYVRVYEKDGPYLEPKEPGSVKEDLPADAKEPINGNYVYDTQFDGGYNTITTDEPFVRDGWNFLKLSQFNGAGNISTDSIDGDNYAKIDITNSGSENYSLQLIQNVTITKGRSYKLTYDAKSTTNRNISVKIGGGADRGYNVYSDSYTDGLTSDIKTYEHVFTMLAESDANARLEFNVGSNTNPVWIGNVKVEEVEVSVNYNGPKEPLKNGNYVYNGTFDRGLVDRLTYWNLEKANEAEANYSVSEATRELFVDITNGGSNHSDIILNQKGIKFEADGKYELTFKARATAEKNIKVVAKDNDGNVIYESDNILVGTTMDTKTVSFNMEGKTTSNSGILEFYLGGDNTTVYLDDLFLKNNKNPDLTGLTTFPLKNGDFSQGITGWESWSPVSGFKVSATDKKAVIDIPKFWPSGDGAEKWAAQFKQTGLPIYKGLEYVISFDASSTVSRNIELVAQDPLNSYERYFEKVLSIGTEINRYSYSFIPTADATVELNFLLGKYADYDPHQIIIDNVVFEVKNSTTNIINNNKFDDGTNSWSSWSQNNDVTGTVAGGKYQLSVKSLGSANWGVQLSQGNFNLKPGKSYRVVFDMASSIPRKVEAIVEKNGDNYDKSLDKVIDVSSDLNTYTLDFVYGGPESDPIHLNFCLGTVEGQDTSIGTHVVTLDNVYLYEVPDLSSNEVEAPKTISKMEATEGTEIMVGEDGGCGFAFPKFNDGASQFNDVKNDIAIFVKQNGEWVSLDGNSDSGWIYDNNWGNWANGGSAGYWFNPVTETTYVKLVSKSNPEVFVEYTLKVEGSGDNENGQDGQYKVNKLNDTETQFVLYKDGVKESDEVILLVKVNGAVEAGYPMTAVGGNKLTHTIGNLKDGDTIEYRFNVIINGAGNLIEGCPTYIHKVGNDVETPKTITSMEVTQGPEIIVGADGGCGFTFPEFNGGASSFNDVKDDLSVLIKEDGQYIAIEESKVWKYDTNWGHFWDGPGGYWFNPVKETTYVKVSSKTNPNVFIEYTLKVGDSENNADQKAAEAVIEKINALPEVITLANKDEVQAARAAYEALTEAQKALVSKDNLEKLVAAEARIAELECQVDADKKVAEAVIEKINALPESITLENKVEVEVARAAYDALTQAQKELISENILDKLIAAEAEIAKLEEAAEKEVANTKAAKEVEEKINELPETITLENKSQIQAARVAFNALTEEQKALVSKEILDKLVAAESKIEELEQSQGENNGGDNGNSGDNNGDNDDTDVEVNPEDNNNDQTDEDDKDLPQTGGRNVLPIVGVGIVLTAAGVVIYRKKEEV